jgi:hypothetical protein
MSSLDQASVIKTAEGQVALEVCDRYRISLIAFELSHFLVHRR